MPLAEFNDAGDLPTGIHIATIEEVMKRFDTGNEQRQRVTVNLQSWQTKRDGTQRGIVEVKS